MNFAMRCYRMHTISLKAAELVGWLDRLHFELLLFLFLCCLCFISRLFFVYLRERGAQQCQCTLFSLCGQCLYIYISTCELICMLCYLSRASSCAIVYIV